MALKSTIFKAELQISDLDRQYYATHHLTLARHPSENDERLMVRVLAFALHAHSELSFTRGLSSEDEPEIWQQNMNGDIELWVELGQIDERRIRKACGRAKEVVIYCYSGDSANIWWKKNSDTFGRFDKLNVINIPKVEATALTQLTQKTMQLSCLREDGDLWLSDETLTVQVSPEIWLDNS